MPAFRNIRLCSKDCVCLYVCPTGATDTENSVIDVSKCTPGCMECVYACPSGAISMLPAQYPPQQPKTDAVVAAQRALVQSKTQQCALASAIAATTSNAVAKQLAEAVALSNQRMAEDLLREAGYLLPQSTNARAFLEDLLKVEAPGFPRDAVELLLAQLQVA